MKLFRQTRNPKKIKRYISFFLMFSLLNNIKVIGSENKSKFLKNNYKDKDFEEIYFQNSIPFKEYDNLENQLNTFLGLYSLPSENTFYPDLSIINTSDSLREMYRFKLNDMAIKEIIYNIDK